MVVALVLGAVVGLGSLVSYRLLFPSPPPLQASIDRLHRRNELVGIANRDQSRVDDLLGRTVGASVGRALENLGLDLGRLRADLALVGRPIEQHMAQKVLLAFFGLSLPAVLLVGFRMMDAQVLSLPVGAGLGLVLAAFFFFVPDWSLRTEADERRKDFRRSLGAFLDLVVISLAGGAGVESALRDAASIGQGWAFAQLRNALEVTALTGETPWAALSRLGDEVGVGELVELSASISLAGIEGARVRDSLAAKATSIRTHALAAAEAEAESVTERMSMPIVLLFVGFLILIGYPAVYIIFNGF